MVKHHTEVKTSEYTVKEKLTSFRAWELKKEASAFSPPDVWSNADMEPVPRELWTWTTATFAAYWFSDLISPGSWSQISSFVTLGLTWWQSILAVLTGGIILSSIVSLNGIIGATLHTPATYGYYFSRFCVVSRMVIAWFWFSVNTYQGGTGVQICLTAIWPSFANLPNHLPASSGTTTQSMVCFFLFWLFQFPFCLIHPSNLRLMFLFKGCTVPIVALGMMGWSIHKAGDQASTVMKASSTVHGLAGYYAFMSAVNSCIATWSTLACNIGDFSRYSKKPTSAVAQVAIVPLLWTICALFGAITSNMTKAIYNESLFQPFDICALWLDNRGGRAAAFFCSAVWAMANMTTNITANSISAANDMTTLFPRWINIFRGQLIAITIGIWAFAPWKVLASASSFLDFMSSYAIVLSPIASILCSDYWIVKRGKISVPDLYNPHGIYSYTWGTNWRAVVALIIAIGPNVPGMANALNSSVDIGNFKYLYAIACIYGFITSSGIYVLLSFLFPAHESLIAEAIYAHDVLDGKVHHEGFTPREDSEKDVPVAKVDEVEV